MSTLYLMVGIPASGKSTAAATILKNGAALVSSDRLREEFFGDEKIQYTEEWLRAQGYDGADDVSSKEDFANTKIFESAFQRCSEILARGMDVIMDSTACGRKTRKHILRKIRNADRTVCIVMAVSFAVCMQRNLSRKRIVPAFFMERSARSFQFPSVDEGFDEIIYYGNISDIDYGEGSPTSGIDTDRYEESSD